VLVAELEPTGDLLSVGILSGAKIDKPNSVTKPAMERRGELESL
jgi:hypothetical protein